MVVQLDIAELVKALSRANTLTTGSLASGLNTAFGTAGSTITDNAGSLVDHESRIDAREAIIIKSGSANVNNTTWTSVVFTAPFATSPAITCMTEDSAEPPSDNVKFDIRNINIGSFDVFHQKGGATWVHYIATDVGNA